MKPRGRIDKLFHHPHQSRQRCGDPDGDCRQHGQRRHRAGRRSRIRSRGLPGCWSRSSKARPTPSSAPASSAGRTACSTSGTRSATCLTLVRNMFTNLNLTDMETCYKAFRGEVLAAAHLSRIGSASSRRSPPVSPGPASGSSRCRSAIRAVRTPKGKRSAGETESPRCGT